MSRVNTKARESVLFWASSDSLSGRLRDTRSAPRRNYGRGAEANPHKILGVCSSSSWEYIEWTLRRCVILLLIVITVRGSDRRTTSRRCRYQRFEVGQMSNLASSFTELRRFSALTWVQKTANQIITTKVTWICWWLNLALFSEVFQLMAWF